MSHTSAAEKNKELLAFIKASPTAFHAVATMRSQLLAAGFIELTEGASAPWTLTPGGSYFVTRNQSSLVAFKVGSEVGAHLGELAFRIAAAHTDSPSYKVKATPELSGPGDYLRLNVEPYGGMIDQSWFDRPLGVAGRAIVRDAAGARAELVDLGHDAVLIPSVAPHLTREKGVFAPDRACDLMPLISAGALKPGTLKQALAERISAANAPSSTAAATNGSTTNTTSISVDDILSWDLFLYNGVEPRTWGLANEFVSAARLDDLQSAFAAFSALVASAAEKSVSVMAAFDNEEVGSLTKQGASSTLLADTLERICQGLGLNHEGYLAAVARSFMASCDNAHAVHPAHPELMDPENRSWLNKGPVIKENAAQHYTTDAFSRAIMEELFRRADVPFQHFANRSDLRGGSTLGNLSNAQVSMHAVDLGLPQLAMHSCYETAGAKDTAFAIDALIALFNADDLRIEGATRFDFVRS